MKRLFVHQTNNAQYNPRDPDLDKEPMWVYVVDKVTNSTTPSIGQILSMIELDDRYCASADWEVTIT
jgi:hypothetical protein